MKKSRRHFLKITGISVLGLSFISELDAFASDKNDFKLSFGKKSEALFANRWGMVIDTRLIYSTSNIKPMIDACNEAHNIPTNIKNDRHKIKWMWSEKFRNTFTEMNSNFNESLERKFFPVLCNHCDKPPCVRACPTKATFKRINDGVVLMDFHRCIGCRFCMAACPFGARSFNFKDPRQYIKKQNKVFPTRTKGVVEKCNFCAERLSRGENPACVDSSKGILTFGDLLDPNSNVRKLLKENYTIRRKQSLGTGPSIFYIV